MALLYDPGTFMPRSENDFAESSWMLTWSDGPWHLHDVEPGGTVYLVRAGTEQRIVWQTRVTHCFLVPYEAVSDLAVEVRKRWGLVIQTPKMNPGGFCIGWRAEPLAHLDRGPVVPAAEFILSEDESLELTGFQQSEQMTYAFRRHWGLPAEPEVFCAGAKLGWLGPVK
jgi:hypothetical protein